MTSVEPKFRIFSIIYTIWQLLNKSSFCCISWYIYLGFAKIILLIVSQIDYKWCVGLFSLQQGDPLVYDFIFRYIVLVSQLRCHNMYMACETFINALQSEKNMIYESWIDAEENNKENWWKLIKYRSMRYVAFAKIYRLILFNSEKCMT